MSNPRLQVSGWFDSLILPSGGARFAGSDFRQWCGPLVYVFLRQDRALYVGYSKNGMGRPTQPTHRQALRARSVCDEVLVWPTRTIADAQKLECLLIAQLHPECNGQLLGALVADQLGIAKGRQYAIAAQEMRRRELTEKERLWKENRKEFIRVRVRGKAACGSKEV